MSLLALEGVRKSFGKNVVLQDIDLTVERTGYPERDVRRVWDRQFAIKDAC